MIVSPSSNPREVLRVAIDYSGHSVRSFATERLDVEERTVRRWLAATVRFPD